MVEADSETSKHRSGTADSFQEVATTIWAYIDALGNPTGTQQMQTLLAPIWHRKQAQPQSGSGSGVAMIDRDELLAQQALNREPPAPAGRASLTGIHVYYPDFAVARLDIRERTQVHLFTLMKLDGRWQIISETVVDSSSAKRNAHFESDSVTKDALKVLEDYYHAVEFGRPEALANIFAGPHWHMKNPEDGHLVAEGTNAFAKRLEDSPSPGYYDDRQVTDVQLLFGNVVMARVDNPTTRSTTMFTMMKLAEGWRIIDKSWAFPNE